MSVLLQDPRGFLYHPTAEIHQSATIGTGTKIWNHCQVHAGAIIGERSTLGHNCTVFGRARVGNGVTLESNIDVWPEVRIDDDVFVGPSAVFTNDLTPRAFEKKGGVYVPTMIHHGASIGANAVIVCGARIGAYAAIAAGACVVKDVPAHALVVGSPARFIRWVCMDNRWTKLEFKNGRSTCSFCGLSYVIEDGHVALDQTLPE